MTIERLPFRVGDENELYKEVMKAAVNLPILGGTGFPEYGYLFHYSDNANIAFFDIRPMDFCWSNIFTANVGFVQSVTNSFRPQDYKALYVIRVGIPPTQDGSMAEIKYNQIISDWVQAMFAGGQEFALGQELKGHQFACVKIQLSSAGTYFLPA